MSHTAEDLLAFGQAVLEQVIEETGEVAVLGELRVVVNDNPRARKLLGRAHLADDRIELFLQTLNDWEYSDTGIEDVIRHEISHHLAYRLDRSRVHDAKWRRRAEQCGAYPRASSTHVERIAYAETREEEARA